MPRHRFGRLILWSLLFAGLLAPTNPLFAFYLFCFGLSIDWALEKKYAPLCLPIAWLLTLPIALLCFPYFTPIATLLTILISPLFAFLAVLGSGSVLSHAYHFDWIGNALRVALDWGLFHIIHWLSAIHLPAYWISWPSAVGLFCLLAALSRLKNKLLFAILGVAAWFFYPHFISPQGAIIFSIGQGDSIALLNTRSDPFLVDAGPPPAWHSNIAPIDRQLETSGIDSVDGLLITHPDLDHYGGSDALLARHTVRKVWLHPALLQSEKADKVIAMIERHEVPIHFLNFGIEPYPGLECRLAPSKNSNEISPLCKFSLSKKHSLLLTGDMDSDSEQFFLRGDKSFLHAEALKVAHHGSRTSSSASFLVATNASYAFISVGERNRYGHPTIETLTRIETTKMKIKRTDRDGTIYWLQWPMLERLLPGLSMVASSSPRALLRSASSAGPAPE